MLPLQDRDDNSKCGPLMIDAAKQISEKGTIEKATPFQDLINYQRSQKGHHNGMTI